MDKYQVKEIEEMVLKEKYDQFHRQNNGNNT